MGGKLCKRSTWFLDSDDEDGGLFGSSVAAKLDDDDDIDPELVKSSRLGDVFAAIDNDSNGRMDYPEFLKGFGLDNSALCQKLFFVLDDDNSGSLDFYEFLKIIDKYRKMTYDERLDFCFKVYDLDDSGFIDRDEFISVIMDLNYAVRSYRSARRMITKLNAHYECTYGDRLERVDVKQFKELARCHGTLLIYPCMGVLERILATAFDNPDNHLGWIDMCRPGQAGMVRIKELEKGGEDDFEAES